MFPQFEKLVILQEKEQFCLLKMKTPSECLLQELFENKGYRVLNAANGELALDV